MPREEWYISIQQPHRTVYIPFSTLRLLHKLNVGEVIQPGVGVINVRELYPRAYASMCQQVNAERRQKNLMRRLRKYPFTHSPVEC